MFQHLNELRNRLDVLIEPAHATLRGTREWLRLLEDAGGQAGADALGRDDSRHAVDGNRTVGR